MLNPRILAVAVTAAALALGGCGGTQETSPAGSETETAVPGPEVSDDRQPPEASGAPQAGEDPVFAALDAVLAAHPDAVVVDVDRDDGDSFDVDVVVGERVLELTVGPDGAVHELERESDRDAVANARTATVTAADAIRRALEQHPAGIVDDAELDRDGGALRWEIDLDNQDRDDLVELEIPAT